MSVSSSASLFLSLRRHVFIGERINTIYVFSEPAGGGPLPADGGHLGRTDGPGHRERAADRQRAVLLQGRHRWDLQRQEGDHEPESSGR